MDCVSCSGYFGLLYGIGWLYEVGMNVQCDNCLLQINYEF